MYQNITLIGNLGKEPEMRYTASGVAVASFSLAVNRSWTGQDGQQQNKTTWFNISCWNKLAETVTQHLTKGRLVLVVGEIEEARAYIDKNTNEARASLEVKAQSVRFLGKNADEVVGHPGPSFTPSTKSSTPSLEEDLPF